MTVAYLVNQYPHVSHTFIRREIAALCAQGVQVERFSLRPPPIDLIDPGDIAEANKTHVILSQGALSLLSATLLMLVMHPIKWCKALAAAIRLGRRSDRGILRHLIYLTEACYLAKFLTMLRARHLHAHFGTNSATVAMLTRLLGGPPFSFTVHGPEEFDKPESLSLGEKIHQAEFVVAISNFCRSQLCRWAQANEWHKLQVVHCGLDADFLNAAPAPVPDAHRLVCVGRLSEQKGQLILLEAVATLRSDLPDLEVILAGDGPMRAIIEHRINELQLQANIRITGWITNAEVRDLIRKSRALVLPSFAEGLPVVIMEALAMNRPVVSTYIAGIPELVIDDNNGWLVPAGDIAALANAIREAMTEPEERLSKMGADGAAAVRERHNAATEAAKLAALFTATGGSP